MKIPFSILAPALLLAVCLPLGGCSRHDSAAAAEALAALSATAALPDYAVVADTRMTVQGEAAADGLSMTQRMWRTGDDAMQKMTTYDVNGDPLFENGSALIDGVYYWFDGESWAEDDTGIAAAANLSWMPLVSWPEEEKDVTVTESDGVYTVEIGEGAFPAMIEEQLSAMEEEIKALEARGLTEEAQDRRQVLDEVRKKVQSIAEHYDQTVHHHVGCSYCEHRCRYWQEIGGHLEEQKVNGAMVVEKWKQKNFAAPLPPARLDGPPSATV